MRLRFTIKAFIFLAVAIFLHGAVNAHVEHPKGQPTIGMDEKLGQTVPLDLTFSDENGNPVRLRQLIHTPTILALVYYRCPNVCSFLLQNLAGVINRMPSEPGREYQVMAISFDETEKSALALEKKKIFLKMIEKPFPEEAWRFLTGEKENIQKLTDAVGFYFKREGNDFLHPVSIIVLSSEGKIIRYLYGTDFLPFDLKMALLEASQGRVGPTTSKVLHFCFSYDPQGRKYVFNILKVTGIVTLLLALSFILFLVFKGKKQPAKEE